ncbi:MAG: tRNA pseudouridine(38-40) synthase TruA [Clostridia bacterium]|nr:tRNA pseudouridine(38-40) synthase TruA [Clostridia bacterium]MCI2000636.1 tRNA pseudouridine(38-40) synthase TruA [Clostridia bacterium]MCI2015291.1 tRNA pseudouridine(38-40) synthase TruA [Clostridia bacterium]
MSMRRILFTIAYDGSDFFGWQKQSGKNIRTVQGCFEEALSNFFKTEVTCIGASRTDRGVHAFGQRAVIDIDTTVPTDRLPLALHSFMPDDISVVDAKDVNDEFNPRYDCVMKTYEYRIYNAKYRNPIYRKYSEYCHIPLDERKMDDAAKAFLGTHDFAAFAASGNSSKTTIRTIFDINVRREGDFVIIKVIGDGFLYNMVRIISGTLMSAGIGKIDRIKTTGIIEKRNRALAGKTAGPEGLTLIEIKY